jgi:copper chaperone CopZ
MRTISLLVRGMGCRRCVREVTARLRDVVGVETVAADAGRSTIRLSGTMTVPDVLEPLSGSSYAPTVLDHSDPSRDR